MSNTAVTTLAISFDDDDDGDGSGGDGRNRIVLEQTSKRPDYFGDLYARVNPTRGLSFKASKGSVTPTEIYSWATQVAVQFSGSSRGQLPVPEVSNVSITPVFILTRQQRYNRENLDEDNGVRFRYDPELSSIIAEKDDKEINVWGAITVNYTVSWLYLKYSPGIIRYAFGRGYEIHIGTIYAYNDFAVASLDMQIEFPDKLDDEEYCRVTSEIVLTPDGPYELPTNWRNGYTVINSETGESEVGAKRDEIGRYFGFSIEIDPDNCFIDERAHLIMNVDAWGRTTTESHHQRTLSPYQLSFNYKPEYTLKFSPPPNGPTNADEYMSRFEVSGNTLDWERVFLSVNKAKITSDLIKRFPGLRGE